MKTNTTETIEATSTRRANGWRAVLAFPNGGRQIGASLYGTMEEAERNARHMLKLHNTMPEACVRDPLPNECQEL